MKIEKLPSGSYRIRKMYKGTTYTVITEYKPTQKEALQLMSAEMDKAQENHKRMTFQAAGEEYIESKRNILSPTTIRGYSSAMRTISKKFLEENIHDVTTMDIQAEINRLTVSHKPKTVRNYHGFISAVLGMFRPELKIYTTLPQKIKNEPYTPSIDDVKKILSEVQGTEYEIPITLACYGMRRSEICALTPDDIEGDIVHINKALVQNDKKEWVIKTTKTIESTRSIIIPHALAEKIIGKGYVYKGHPGCITKHLEKIEKSLGIPKFPLHKLRHFFASEMSFLGVPEADILKLGGWGTDHVMKAVYRHSMIDKEEKSKRDAAERFKQTLFS